MIEKEDLEIIIKDEGLITWAECDSAIVGIVSRCGMGPLVLYDRDKLIEVFTGKGMTHSDAEEWVSYNIEGAYVGDETPMIMEPLFSEAQSQETGDKSD